MGISVAQKGDFRKTEKFLKKSLGRNYMDVLQKYAELGVARLEEYTPKETGITAYSWDYEIIQNGSSLSIVWKNYHVNRHVNIALILQYGHATRTGGYVEGRDYINPALQPIFDDMADAAWREVVES